MIASEQLEPQPWRQAPQDWHEVTNGLLQVVSMEALVNASMLELHTAGAPRYGMAARFASAISADQIRAALHPSWPPAMYECLGYPNDVTDHLRTLWGHRESIVWISPDQPDRQKFSVSGLGWLTRKQSELTMNGIARIEDIISFDPIKEAHL